MRVNWDLLKEVLLKILTEWVLFFDYVGAMIVLCILIEWFPFLEVLWAFICIPISIYCMLLYIWVKCDGEPLF